MKNVFEKITILILAHADLSQFMMIEKATCFNIDINKNFKRNFFFCYCLWAGILWAEGFYDDVILNPYLIL